MKYFGWVFLFFIVVYILPLGSRPLILPEYGFAETAREMLLSGDYVTPRLRGETVSDVPAPAYYPGAKGIQLFGKNSFAVRFPSALAAGLTALFIWILIKQMLRDEKLAALSAVIYLSFSVVYGSGTLANEASLGAMLTVGCCGCMFMVFQEEKFNRRKVLNLILSGALMGLGFLVSGFDAVIIPLLSGIGYMLWDKKLRQLPLFVTGCGIIAFLVAMPWMLAINRAVPGYWQNFVRSEWQAFLPSCGDAPWYWQLFFFVLGAFPAALLIPAAGVVGKEAWKGFLRQPLFRFAFCFLFLPLIFFSFNCTWDVNCVLACFAPLALLIAAGVRVYFNSGCHHRSYNWVMTLWGAFLIIAGGALIALRFMELYTRFLPISPLFYPVMGTVLIFAGAAMIYSAIGNWRGRLYLFFFGIGLVMLFLPWFFNGNAHMPGEALQEIKTRYIDRLNPEVTVIVERDDLANAAAWEFDRRDIPSYEKKYIGNKLPQYLIRFASSGESDAIFTKDGIALHKWAVSPTFQLLKDLTGNAH
ncbi:MAG: phospholipid carrier-dependent glycosyltransferase [Lentisphaerae bacterium]|nr:phospholipid carrier-dependent glycosyltransferase [Lentisphaerota bacterium]